MSRRRITGKELTEAVKTKGIEPINSDEEQNMVLDETQQEKFISEIQIIASQYISTWRKLFAWISLLILYVHSLSLLGLVPFTRSLVSLASPRSVTLQFLLSPTFAGASFFGDPLVPIFVQLGSIFIVMLTVRECMQRASLSYPSFTRVNRILGFTAFCAWTILAYMHAQNPIWGRHLVLSVSCPLLSLAAETFRGAQELAKEGVDKLQTLNMMLLRCALRHKTINEGQLRVRKPVIIPIDNLSKLTNRDFSMFIYESASIESMRAIGLSSLVATIESRKDLMTHKDVFRLMTGLCRLDVIHNRGILASLSQCFDARMHQLMAHDIAILAVELSSCTRRIGNAGSKESILMILDFLVDEFKRKIDAASPRDLAYMVSAVADMGLLDGELMEMVGISASIQMGLFQGPDLADLLLGFAVLGAKHSRLLIAAVPHLTTRMTLLYDHQILGLVRCSSRYIFFEFPSECGGEKMRFIDRLVYQLETRAFDSKNEGWQDFEESLTSLGVTDRVPRFLQRFRRRTTSRSTDRQITV